MFTLEFLVAFSFVVCTCWKETLFSILEAILKNFSAVRFVNAVFSFSSNGDFHGRANIKNVPCKLSFSHYIW